jgi:hypothetical protein
VAQCKYLGRIEPGQGIQLTANQYNFLCVSNRLVWCGGRRGKGALTLTINDGGSHLLCQASAFIEIKDIKEMYERWTVGDDIKKAPLNNAYLASEELPPSVSAFEYGDTSETNTPYILFVHGWNMEQWGKDRFAETAFKRLYWQGYQGKFGSFRWPTANRFKGSLVDLVTDPRNFDNSEFNAWKSGAGLHQLLIGLNSKYSDNIYLMAHSMGNVVAGEALRLAGTNRLVNTYVAMQAAVASRAYDSNTPARSIPYFLDSDTPDRYGNYWTNGAPSYFIGSAGAGVYVNFFNTNDYALDKWQINQNLKPDSGYDFYPISGNVLHGGNFLYFPEDTYELFAHVIEAHCYALGAQADVHGSFQKLGTPQQANLPDIWPIDPLNANYTAHLWHSAQFRADTDQAWQFWRRMITTFDLQQ